MIRPIKVDDVAPVVRVYMSSFVNFFLTFLGPAFLKELYKGTITDPSGIAIVAESDGGMYGFVTGTMGRSHGTGIFLEAAKLLQNVREMRDLLFLFVGKGYERDEIERRIREEKIANALLCETVDRKDLADMLSMADVTLVSLKPGFSDLSVPSKVLGYMAAGRPVLALVDERSDTAEIIKEAGCGEILKPDDPVALAHAIQKWIDNYELCRSAGRAACQYCETQLHPDILLDKLALELEMASR